ncbi:MAG: radical SAM protein [Candidatus Aminicenantaceae bacterium]
MKRSTSNPVVTSIKIKDFVLWEKMREKKDLFSFDMEITARCNLNCRHCYINLPAGDKRTQRAELTLEEIERIAQEAVELGAFWCLITGGEPLLRKDFPDIYMCLKKKGLLVSVFTNATFLHREHIELFKKYPPRDIEVSVYGVTPETYESVTRKPGSFAAFERGMDLLLQGGIKVRFKAMALRSNVHELPQISEYCRRITKDYFRFDPLLHLRVDGDTKRNEEIIAERLSPEEIVAIERADTERFESLEKGCDKLIVPDFSHADCNHLFHCGAGHNSFSVSYDGKLRLCSSLWHPDCIYDLRRGSLRDAWTMFVPRVRDMRSDRQEFLEKCRRCQIINLCLWCPAHSHLETGEMDSVVEYFCRVAHARAEALQKE